MLVKAKLEKVSATIKMFNIPSLPQPSIKKLSIFLKSLATFTFKDVMV